MQYKDYEGYSKTYVLVHNTGFGVMEDNYIEHDVVYETDDYEDAQNKALEFKIKNNKPEDIQSSWCYNTYHINVNTLSNKGQELLSSYKDYFDDTLKDIDKSGYIKIENHGVCFYFKELKNFTDDINAEYTKYFKNTGFIMPIDQDDKY